jgi:hypothetical protein
MNKKGLRVIVSLWAEKKKKKKKTDRLVINTVGPSV